MSSEPADVWHDLIDRHLHGELNESEKESLTELLDSDPSARMDFVQQVEWDTRFAEVLRESSDSRASLSERNALITKQSATLLITAMLAIAAVTVLTLTARLYFQRPTTERQIATINGLSGSVRWTGDGGRVAEDLGVASQLTGGTIEGMAPGSWVELEFNDGSIVTISGNSMLTFSDHGQKELYLKEGNVTADVKPQPSGKPMLIHTRSAMLEVLGTHFNVEAGLASTMLNVNEGQVRVKRLSDGSSVVVPAKHRVIAAADREMLPVLVPDSVNRWKSQLRLGTDGTYGKWSPATEQEDAKLRAVPFTTPRGKTIYTASFGVSRGDNPPVILRGNPRLRVRGQIASRREVYFGVTVRHANGEFAGRFQAIKPAVEFQSGEDFELTVQFRDFRLDPSLLQVKDKLPSAPSGLVVEAFWFHTLDQPSGLEIIEVELLPQDPTPAAQASLSN